MFDGSGNFVAWSSGQYMCIYKMIQYFSVIYKWQGKS